MRTSDCSKVIVAHASRLRSREVKEEPSCWGAETRRSSLFFAVSLAMPLRDYQIGVSQKTVKLFGIVFDLVHPKTNGSAGPCCSHGAASPCIKAPRHAPLRSLGAAGSEGL